MTQKNIFILLITLIAHTTTTYNRPTIQPTENALEKLQESGLWQPETPLRLHLGCGEQHFSGYVNVDFPPTEHTTQIQTGADMFANIATLKFPAHSVDEIRSHHVFEHFNRNVAMALLVSWFEALKIGGKLVIETPDFEASIRVFANPAFSYRSKQATLRHIFGSHEAFWAMHYDGWYKEKFEHVLSTLGYSEVHCQFIVHPDYHLVPNILVTARKTENISRETLYQRAKNILSESLVNSSETVMFQVWCRNFETAIKNMILN